MKNYLSYLTYSLIFISINSIGTNLEAKGLLNAITDFLTTLNQDNQPQQNIKYTLSRKQAENYIDIYIASLRNDLRLNISDYDIQRIREKTYTAFNQSSTIYIWISGIRMYNKDMIDQFLLSAIIEVVEANTYNYAYAQTKNSAIASKISQTIRTQLMQLIEKKYTLDAYNLRPYFGSTLNQTILKEIAILSQQYYYPNNVTTYQSYNYGSTNYGASGSAPAGYSGSAYASQACCICFDNFGGATERIFLKPCGHDICTMCALDYFFPNNLPDQTKKCPICRNWVNLEELYNDVL